MHKAATGSLVTFAEQEFLDCVYEGKSLIFIKELWRLIVIQSQPITAKHSQLQSLDILVISLTDYSLN